MGNETSQEREFAENIERLLAGEEIKLGEDVSEDYRTAINFARKLIELRHEPSLQFKEQLKERLLSELVKQEVEAARRERRRNWLWDALKSLVPQSSVWRTAIVTLLVAVVTAGVLWRAGIFTQPQVFVSPEAERAVLEAERPEADVQAAKKGVVLEETAAPAAAAEALSQSLLELTVVPSEEAIVSPFGETVTVELTFKNTHSESVTITPFPPAIYITGEGAVRPVHLLPEGTKSLELPPLETETYTLIWDQRDSNGEQVNPGWYTVFVGEVTVSKETEPTNTVYQPGS